MGLPDRSKRSKPPKNDVLEAEFLSGRRLTHADIARYWCSAFSISWINQYHYETIFRQAFQEAGHVEQADRALAEAEVAGGEVEQAGQVLRDRVEGKLPLHDLRPLLGRDVGQKVVLVHHGLLVQLSIPLCPQRRLVVLHDRAVLLLEPHHQPVCGREEEGLQGDVPAPHLHCPAD